MIKVVPKIRYQVLCIEFMNLRPQEVCFADKSGTEAKSSPKLKSTKNQQNASRLGISQNSPLNQGLWKTLSNIIQELKAAQKIIIERIRFKIVAILLKRSIMLKNNSYICFKPSLQFYWA